MFTRQEPIVIHDTIYNTYKSIIGLSDGINTTYLEFVGVGGAADEASIQSRCNDKLNELNNVSKRIDNSKETLKPAVIQYLFENPELTQPEFISWLEQTHGWPERALFERLTYEYAINAEAMGLVELVDTEPATIFTALMSILAVSTPEQIAAYFGE